MNIKKWDNVIDVRCSGNWHAGEQNKDSLLGRSTEGRKLKHFNVCVFFSLTSRLAHTHTHCLFCLLPHSLAPSPALWKDFYVFTRHLICKPNSVLSLTMCWRVRHPPHPPQPRLLADIWKCFGPVLEVTVWTNRGCTSTFAMWQAFIYLPNLVYCMETPPTNHFLLSTYFSLLLTKQLVFLPSVSLRPNPALQPTWRAPLGPHNFSPVRVKTTIKGSEDHSNHSFLKRSVLNDESISVTLLLLCKRNKPTNIKLALMWWVDVFYCVFCSVDLLWNLTRSQYLYSITGMYIIYILHNTFCHITYS